MKRIAFALPLLAALGATPAFAHVTLEVPHAAPGASYKAVFRIPHGCSGAATTALRIQIPEGVIAAKPMPHPGWTIGIKTGDYAKSYAYEGSEVKSGVTEIDFTGGNLPDAYYDEFVVTGTISDSFKAGDVVFFPVVQECGTDAVRWIEMPKDGQKLDELKRPAPHLDIVANP